MMPVDSQLSQLLQGAFLGVIQGLTEFLPISSSGHLVVLPKLLGWTEQGLAFDIAANTGTLVALVWYFRRDLMALAQRPQASQRNAPTDNEIVDLAEAKSAMIDRRVWPQIGLLPWLAIATIPVGIVGFLGSGWFANEARNLPLIAWASIGFGILLGLADWKAPSPGQADENGELEGDTASPATRSLSREDLTVKDAVLLGLAQALALIPGTSRSGVVMTAGLLRGFDRPTAARWAFLMAIPVGILVALKDTFDLMMSPVAVNWVPLAAGFVAAAISGYFVIAFLLQWLRSHGMMPFVVYRILLGFVLLWIHAN